MKSQPNTGFSLLEVLIAMAVISIALLALSRTGGAAPRQLAALEQRTIAQWVAQNAISEIRLNEGFPPVGQRQGRENMAQRDWSWQAQVQDTSDDSIRRIDVSVFIDGADQPVATHTGFAGRY
ncbi:MAG: type II secretion system minor pseudopilin GspI [Wenzhouxiangellaceae bacterium]